MNPEIPEEFDKMTEHQQLKYIRILLGRIKKYRSRPRKGIPGWLPDEMAHAGRENLDIDHVIQYDTKEDANAERELEILASAGLTEESVVVDLGAGTGQFALAAAQKCARVIAVDISPVMLDELRSKKTALGLLNVEIIRSGFLTYEHQGAKPDVVYSRFALHHLPDFWKVFAIKKIRHMIRPGGLFRLWDVVYHFDLCDAEKRLETWCSTVPVKGAAHEWTRDDIEEHIRDEHSTYTWLLEPIMERCGFKIEGADYSSDGFFAKYLARAH